VARHPGYDNLLGLDRRLIVIEYFVQVGRRWH